MKAETLPGFEERNEDFGLTAPDGKHYWLTPEDLMGALNAEFAFDFDPCPHPRPEGFDGLTAEWGSSNYVNPPFKGPTAWVRKAISESKKGKRVVFVFPIDKWVLMLLEAGATVRNLLGALRGRGLLDYPAPGVATLTADGARVARAPDETPTTEALQRAIHDRLDNTESRVLQAIIDAYPDRLTKQDAGQRSGYSVGDNVGGTFGNILGRLRSLGLIEYPAPGRVVALPVLFLE